MEIIPKIDWKVEWSCKVVRRRLEVAVGTLLATFLLRRRARYKTAFLLSSLSVVALNASAIYLWSQGVGLLQSMVDNWAQRRAKADLTGAEAQQLAKPALHHEIDGWAAAMGCKKIFPTEPDADLIAMAHDRTAPANVTPILTKLNRIEIPERIVRSLWPMAYQVIELAVVSSLLSVFTSTCYLFSRIR